MCTVTWFHLILIQFSYGSFHVKTPAKSWNLYPLTPNYLKFGTNVPLHELGKCAKLFCVKPYHSDFRGGFIIFLFCLKIKAVWCRRISVFFKKNLKYFHAFNISEIWYVGQIRIVESKYPTILTLYLIENFYFAHPNAWLQNQQLFIYVATVSLSKKCPLQFS